MEKEKPLYKIITSDDVEFGPVELGTIKQWYLEQRIAKTDKVFSYVSNEWLQLSNFFDVDSWEHLDSARQFLGGRVFVVVGDITKQHVDAIVNAANYTLRGGGGVDGAIHEAGGPEILKECEEIRRTRYPQGLPTGEAVITTGGALPARYVIHTVGPVKGVHGERDAELLASCYRNSLALAVRYGLSTIAFPAISTGVYGYPKEEAAAVSSKAIREFLAKEPAVKEVRLVFFTEAEANVYLMRQEFGLES